MRDEAAAAADRAAPEPPPKPEDVRVSHLRFPEAVNLALQLRSRADNDWQRVITINAALIVVMIFFANQQYTFATARIAIYVFYSYNVLLCLISLRESHAGLQQVAKDIALFPEPDLGGHSRRWLMEQSFRHDFRVQGAVVVLIWAAVGFLLLGSLVLGYRPLQL